MDQIAPLVESLRARFDSGATRPLDWRRAQLEGLARMMDERGERFAEALAADLGKPALESRLAEVDYCKNEARHLAAKLRQWSAPEPVPGVLFTWPGSNEIWREPLGVVCIISPWNYPLGLCAAPLIAALAAGNTALVKPSEVSAHTSAAIAELFPQYLDPEAVKIVEGGIPETTRLLEQRFDHICYTGNGAVARIVMKAAAEHLTPVTLELGGKSPCIVDKTIDPHLAARRICWGKFQNAGQTCVAPDYVLVRAEARDALVEALSATIRRFYGDDPRQSTDCGRIINARHHRRLTALLDSGTVAVGGEHDEAARYIAPTVLTDVDPAAPVMQEEIFGPILPVLTVDSIDAAIAFVNARPKPLALYVFSRDRATQDAVLTRTSSGAATVNHTWLYMANPALPFGGVGESGMGAYHGRHGFEQFSHRKAVLRKATWFEPPMMYPPFTEAKRKWLDRLS